jgi:predicted transcriptional regulator
MSSQVIKFEIPEDLVATVDEIASNRSVDRSTVLRDALAEYLAEYLRLQADLEESERQFAAGETVPHEEVVAWFHAQHTKRDESEAA